MRISDWSSDVCSSDLIKVVLAQQVANFHFDQVEQFGVFDQVALVQPDHDLRNVDLLGQQHVLARLRHRAVNRRHHQRSEEHTSELQSLMRISYAVFCLKKKKINLKHINRNIKYRTYIIN